MKLYRYMSSREFALVTSGVQIQGHTHATPCTNSNGVCFLGENTILNSNGRTYNYSPEDCLEFLRGIVCEDVLVEFEVPENTQITKAWGKYADPCGAWDDTIIIDEYCVPEYDRDSLVPIRYGVLSDKGYKLDWYNC